MILGIVLVAVLLFLAARYAYQRFWLPRSENHHKCQHCGEYYEDHPYYCPHCGGVVDERKNE
ncbi:MAG: hypothetical protein ACLFN7_05960 [Candidatus Acetothermia bacterium]